MELTRDESDHLVRALLASRAVSQRHHFFNWVHGPLQALIPHEILLCGIADESGRLLHECFSASRYFREEHFKSVCHPTDGLLSQLLQDWHDSSRPRLIAAQDSAAPGWYAKLDDLELKNVAFHGSGGLDGQVRGYASFSRVRRPFDAKLELYLDILLPHLLATLMRVMSGAETKSAHNNRRGRIISGREAEVLAWVREGKTNAEIAQILGLSALTIKNHVRHCMQKLVVSTRGQAVTKAISLGLLKSYTTRVRDPSRNSR